MFRFLDERIEYGNWFEKMLAILAYGVFATGYLVASIFITGCIIIKLETLFPSEDAVIYTGIVIATSIFLAPLLISLYRDSRQLDKLTSTSTKDPHIISEYSRIPHFSKMLGEAQSEDLIERETFSKYVKKSGLKSRYIKVSKSDKWVCILGGYFPTDLLCGYNKKQNELYTIDGMIVKLPKKARLPFISADIEAYFKDRGEYYKSVPPKAGLEFNNALKTPRSKLSKADWGRVRYLWEKAIVSSSHNYWQNNNKNQRLKPVSEDGKVNTAIFKRVYSDKEINRTAEAIHRKDVPLSRYLDFKEYKNEYCVCNGVELLRVLGNPKNIEGIDFLFDCLCDVDEAYFPMAVDVLKKYPRSETTKKIEENAKIAYESGNVLKLAGVIYLAKVLEYDSDYLKQLKEQQEQSEAVKAAAEKAENTVNTFDLDEKALFGSEEVQVFSPGSYQTRI
ncbi:hypothetical protein SAMN04487770_1586 [Butyrivibrio sp. ob235]|uniref:hypothetical protein n=1 Tax=Butyrivibrio sp. ob235 TaxID=1761780 RepID=UPI0008D6BC52|nr:hypothetical protein [Butyrivibrio sp. ob235]SEM65125.1 hypothetical protein SAMN04487770_1586 [Butyrivibrio sp. ob235]